MPDTKEMIPISKIKDSEVALFADEARNLLISHPWCTKVTRGYLAWACAGVLGVFLFRIVPSRPGVDTILWVITGDLPPACLVCDNAETWQEALKSYIYEMKKWVRRAKTGRSIEGVIPVNVPATPEYARMLDKRLNFIRRHLINAQPETLKGDT